MKNLIFFLLISSFAHAISNGRDLSAKEFPAVVMISDREGSFIGSGVYVGQDTILTADHCVYRTKVSNLTIDGKLLAVKIIRPEKQESEESLDLAFVILKKKSLKTIPLTIATKAPRKDSKIEIIGFGPTIADSNSLKRIGWNRIFNINDSFINIVFDLDAQFNIKSASGALPGDSGGPMLSQGQVVGIAGSSVFGISNYTNLTSKKSQLFLKKGFMN